MTIKSVIFALLAGLAAFLIVGVAVTELTQPMIEFSLFLGIPAGLVIGAFTAATVYRGLATDAPVQRRRISGAFAAFGAGFLVALIVLGWIFDIGMTFAIFSSVVIAFIVAAIIYLRGSGGTTPDTSIESETPGGAN